MASESQMEGSDDFGEGFDQESLLATQYYTPHPKQILPKSGLQPVNLDFSPSSGGVSSATSVKEEGSRSPSSSSSDSEPESFIKSVIHYQGTPVNTDGEQSPEGKLKEDLPDMERPSQFVGEGENRSYDELLKKFIKNEEELRVSNFKLQLSEEEIIKLKNQIEKSEGQLDNARKELTLNKEELEYEKGQVLELQKQTAELETHVPDCCYKIANLVEELEVANEHLKISNNEVARLRKELESRSSETHQLQGHLRVTQENVVKLESWLDSERNKVRELEDTIAWFKANETNHELEVQRMKAEMLDVQEQFSFERDQLHSEIVSLSEMKIDLTSRLEEWECRCNLLEKKLRQCETENLEQEELYATQQIVMQGEISSLKEELSQRRHEVEAVNKEFDKHKQKFDMLMTEKDEANAKMDKLKAEISLRDDQIANTERQLLQQHTQQAGLTAESEARLYLLNVLKLKVEELEKEVTRQNVVISDRDEEKREAIRQLCFSIDHYRSGYKELLQAFTGHRRRTVIAS
ncbi:protein NETWORKED 4B-like [Trifolium pratense]|uniref:protein NETWORKED 4B-like n=1 Tax=Trifolium pratense TaxID=57577 RepID=UPI001E68FF8F|nr:protein NETWORKED 4B-like [Trifolium pratense]